MPVNDIKNAVSKTDLREVTPVAAWQYVTVTFSGANTDYDIRHDLRPIDPEAIDYQLVRADRSTTIYNDQSATRKAWGTGYIILRSSVANAVVTLLLTIRRT
jgi:hypothetical protein